MSRSAPERFSEGGKGLALARELKATLDAVVKALEADKALPAAVRVEKPRSVPNPFG